MYGTQKKEWCMAVYHKKLINIFVFSLKFIDFFKVSIKLHSFFDKSDVQSHL